MQASKINNARFKYIDRPPTHMFEDSNGFCGLINSWAPEFREWADVNSRNSLNDVVASTGTLGKLPASCTKVRPYLMMGLLLYPIHHYAKSDQGMKRVSHIIVYRTIWRFFFHVQRVSRTSRVIVWDNCVWIRVWVWAASQDENPRSWRMPVQGGLLYRSLLLPHPGTSRATWCLFLNSDIQLWISFVMGPWSFECICIDILQFQSACVIRSTTIISLPVTRARRPARHCMNCKFDPVILCLCVYITGYTWLPVAKPL